MSSSVFYIMEEIMEKVSLDLSCFNITEPAIVNSRPEKMEIGAVKSVR